MPTSQQLAAKRAYDAQVKLRPMEVRGKRTPNWHGWLLVAAMFAAWTVIAYVAGRVF